MTFLLSLLVAIDNVDQNAKNAEYTTRHTVLNDSLMVNNIMPVE